MTKSYISLISSKENDIVYFKIFIEKEVKDINVDMFEECFKSSKEEYISNLKKQILVVKVVKVFYFFL